MLQDTCNFINKGIPAHVFSCEFSKIFRGIFLQDICERPPLKALSCLMLSIFYLIYQKRKQHLYILKLAFYLNSDPAVYFSWRYLNKASLIFASTDFLADSL